MLRMSSRMLLHSLAVLAKHYDSGVRMNCKDIEKECGLQERTIAVNMTKLAKAGILDSITGGSMRGYKFTKDPRTVSVGEVLEVVEGLHKFQCGKEVLDGIICHKDKGTCKIYNIYHELYENSYEKLYCLSIHDFSLASMD